MPPWRTAELTVIKSRVCQTCEDQVRLARARAQPSCTLHLSGLSVRFAPIGPGEPAPKAPHRLYRLPNWRRIDHAVQINQ
jgi:hypothetical protein